MTTPADTEQKHAQQIIQGLKHVLSTEDGRAWYYDLIGKCGVFRSDMIENTNFMCFEAGRKNTGLMLMAEAMRADRDFYIKMQIEATNREKEKDYVTEQQTTDTSSESSTDKFTAIGNAASSTGLV